MKSNSFDGMVCSIAGVLDIVGDRWAVLILRDLLLGLRRYEDLRKSTGVTNATLSDRLRILADNELIERRQYQSSPDRYEYLPTRKGKDLFPVIERRRAAGQVTVQEVNDNYFDIQPWNTRAAMWQNRSTRGEMMQSLAAVDAVQTSTEPLAKIWSKWARKVAVFPNQLTQATPLPTRPAYLWAGRQNA